MSEETTEPSISTALKVPTSEAFFSNAEIQTSVAAPSVRPVPPRAIGSVPLVMLLASCAEREVNLKQKKNTTDYSSIL